MRNINMRIIILTGILSVLWSAALCQDSLRVEASFHAVGSSNDIRPMWLTANQWGVYGQYGKSEAILDLSVKYPLLQKKNISMEAGIRGIANADIGNSVLQEIYLSGKLWEFDYSIGKEQHAPLVYDDDLTTGLYLMNTNARPIPRITAGIFDYIPLGFTNNWVEVKGAISQGWLNDDRGSKSNSASELLLHEKYAYVRLGNTKLKPYVGLVHSALFGGVRPDGTEIPVDFWATFMAKGSATLGGGEETNAAGAHMGLWDFGFNWETSLGDVHFYYQKPFADASGLKIYNGYNKDYTLGVLAYPKNIKWLKGVSLEVFRTDYQSGYGIPDPLYPVDYNGHSAGSIIWMYDIEDDFDGFMYEVFGETQTGWTEDEVMRYLEVELNEGHKYGGRDDYMNNGTYYSGWTYHGMNMGMPMYHTASTFDKYAGQSGNDHGIFYNNRVNGVHLGASGTISQAFDYRTKFTYSLNKGAYAEEFTRRYSWDRTPNYYFSDSKHQYYTMIELNYKPAFAKDFMINGMFAADFGDLYNSVGGRLSFIYKPCFKVY